MTKDERELARKLNAYDAVQLHHYKSVNGKEYYKVKHDGKPLNLVKKSTVERMERRVGLVDGKHALKTLNVAQLKANLLDWQTKFDERMQKRTNKDN
jgi:hypothetical protein